MMRLFWILMFATTVLFLVWVACDIIIAASDWYEGLVTTLANGGNMTGGQ